MGTGSPSRSVTQLWIGLAVSTARDGAADREHIANRGIKVCIVRVRLDTEGVQGLAEEAACCGSKNHIHDFGVRQPLTAQPVDVCLVNACRIISDLLCEIHD